MQLWWVFFPDTPVSSTNKTDCYDITEILLKVALNTKTLTLTLECNSSLHFDLSISDIRECEPQMWKAIACALHTKPCHKKPSHLPLCRYVHT
jgi:hypothetical protein